MELKNLKGLELAELLRGGKVSARDALEYHLERVERLNPDINAVVHMDTESARAQADAADAVLAKGEVLGALHGMPMSIKDGFGVQDMVSTGGSPVHANHRPPEHSAVAQRLVDAGAIIYGKTNVPLYSGDLQSYNDVYGTTNNPWDISRGPGGSSGGSAAALALGMTPLEYGSDIGGSIRNPAHFSGVYGLKPSFGIVPLRGYIASAELGVSTRDLSVAGPLARSVDDLEFLLGLTAGPTTLEKPGWKLDLPPAKVKSIKDMRVAVTPDIPDLPVDNSVRELIAKSADALANAGAQVETVKLPVDMQETLKVYFALLYPIIGAGFPDEVLEAMRQVAENDSPEIDLWDKWAAAGATSSYARWLEYHELRTRSRLKWHEFFNQWHCLMMPVAPIPAFPHDHAPFAKRTIQINGEARPYSELVGWAAVATMNYLPATVIPLGQTEQNLPVGAQLLSGYLHDYTSLACARLADEVIGGFAHPPGF